MIPRIHMPDSDLAVSLAALGATVAPQFAGAVVWPQPRAGSRVNSPTSSRRRAALTRIQEKLRARWGGPASSAQRISIPHRAAPPRTSGPCLTVRREKRWKRPARSEGERHAALGVLRLVPR